jgi:hypothetical protein
MSNHSKIQTRLADMLFNESNDRQPVIPTLIITTEARRGNMPAGK